MKASWDFIGGAEPGDANAIRNPVTQNGAVLGAELARIYEDSEDGVDRRCEDCAFRLGTRPNQSEATLMDALKCIMERDPFFCHVHKGNVCAGYDVGTRPGANQSREGI